MVALKFFFKKIFLPKKIFVWQKTNLYCITITSYCNIKHQSLTFTELLFIDRYRYQSYNKRECILVLSFSGGRRVKRPCREDFLIEVLLPKAVLTNSE